MYKKKKKKKNKNGAMLFLARGTLVLLAFFATMTWLAEKKEPIVLFESPKAAFIEKISGKAQQLQSQYGVLPSISIAQAILESNWGTSGLALRNQNFYGIKGGDVTEKERFRTKEFLEETKEWIEIDASFKKYDSWEESMEDHARLLVNGTKWNPELYKPVIEAVDYKEAAYALKKAGYATDPDYPEKLISLIEQYNLQKHDRLPPAK